MKKILTLLLSLLMMKGATAQYCGTTVNSIIPMTYTVPGFSPPSNQQACISDGQWMSDTIYFTNFTSIPISNTALTSLRIDSINNLPSGLCWSSNKSNNTFAGGENGVIQISGTTYASPGQYKLTIWVTLYGSSISLTGINADTLGLYYYLRVSCPNTACLPIDTVLGRSTDFIPDTTCTYTPPGLITTSGSTQLCTGSSETLYANGSAGATYLWSTGATTQSIVIDSPGIYTVVIGGNGISTTSSIQIYGIAPPTALFTVLPDTSTPHVWYILNQCSGNNIGYHWTWGDGTWTDSVVAPSHTYNTAGYYNICVTVSSDSGCSSTYCDSNVYLYKTENQMVQVNVVTAPLGINSVNGAAQNIKYYAGAIHFAEAINTPTDVKVYDLSGRVVISKDKFTGAMLALNSSDFAPGVYIIHLQNTLYSQSAKLNIAGE